MLWIIAKCVYVAPAQSVGNIMRDIKVYIEQIPENYVSDISITITCKKSERTEAEAIIDYLRSMVNITFKKGLHNE